MGSFVGCREGVGVGGIVGGLVSPGLVGREVVGAGDGKGVGGDDVGMEVGASMRVPLPTRTVAFRKLLISVMACDVMSGAAANRICTKCL